MFCEEDGLATVTLTRRQFHAVHLNIYLNIGETECFAQRRQFQVQFFFDIFMQTARFDDGARV